MQYFKEKIILDFQSPLGLLTKGKNESSYQSLDSVGTYTFVVECLLAW